MKQIIGLNNDHMSQPMFLGEDLGIQRYDQWKYKTFFRNFTDQLASFWRPEEVSLQKDRADYKELDPPQQRIFTLNLKYQILLDSVQSRALPYLMHFISLPELEAAMSVWSMMETLHSYSYTYVIKNVYADPSSIFNSIMDDQKILERASSTTKEYNSLIDVKNDSIDELKRKIFRTLIGVYILEGIRFYVSFACTYAFAENKMMEGNAKIISFINRDENLHLGITTAILKNMQKNEDEGFAHLFDEMKDECFEMFRQSAEEEIEWAEYLFQDGSMLGLNVPLLTGYMKWLTNKRMKAIGFEPLYEHQGNPLGWIDNWTSSKTRQNAPQETEITSYRIGSVVSDLDNAEFDF